jgi:AdoMet-dependent heme synthase
MNQHPLHLASSFSAPISVFLNLTRQCNLRCIYCSSETTPPQRCGTGELTDDEMLALADRLIEARVFRFALTGGEPFLRRELVFALLEKLMPFGQLSLYTNGTMLTQADARRLGSLPGKLTVYVSADSPYEELNATTRGKHVLARVLRAGRWLAEEGIKVNVNCVVGRNNYEHLPQLADLLDEHGLSELHLIRMAPIGYATCHPGLLLDAEAQRAAWKTVEDLRTRERKLKVRPADLMYWEGYEETVRHYQDREPGDPPTLLSCSAGKDQCAITADGYVVPCNFLMEYPCGNVREQDVIEIWQRSQRLQEFRDLRHVPVTDVPECASCRFNRFCPGGCRAIALATSGSLTGCDRSCIYLEDQGVPARRAQLPVVC